MATDVGIGSTAYVRYGYETTINTSPGDAALKEYFGHNVKFKATPKNNIKRVFNLNDRNAGKYTAGKFDGVWNARFEASNFYFLKGIFGAVATAGAGPYTHTYSEANKPPTVTIQSSEDLDTDSERTHTGCVMDKLTLNMAVDQNVTGSLDGVYMKESKDTVLNTAGNAADPEDVFTFAHATLELPNATELFEVQSLDVNIMNTAELIWGLGSRLPTKRVLKARLYEFVLNKVREADSEILDNFYGSATALSDPGGPSDIANLEITLSNEESGTALRSLVALFNNLQPIDPEYELTPNEVTKEQVTLYALKLDPTSEAVYTNNTTPHP